MLDDEIDSEQLQAEIDISLSFANDLVSAYLAPTASSLQQTAYSIHDLKEHINQPPRLGLGAKVSSTSEQSQDALRLKKTLTGHGKRSHDHVQPSLQESDDEDEGRGRVIVKKARIDPFGPKKKSQPQTPSFEDKKTLIPPKTPPPNKANLKTITSPTMTLQDDEEQIERDLLMGTPKGPSSAVSISPFSTPSSPTSGKAQIRANLLRRPLLNLDGPPIDTGLSPGIKKRKRKKKKKKTDTSIVAPIGNDGPSNSLSEEKEVIEDGGDSE